MSFQVQHGVPFTAGDFHMNTSFSNNSGGADHIKNAELSQLQSSMSTIAQHDYSKPNVSWIGVGPNGTRFMTNASPNATGESNTTTYMPTLQLDANTTQPPVYPSSQTSKGMSFRSTPGPLLFVTVTACAAPPQFQMLG
jgi:hypothetical protein